MSKVTMKTDVWLFVHVLVLILFIDLRSLCQSVGEKCDIDVTGERGTCKVNTDCPGIQEQANEQVHIKICGYIELTKIVICCKDEIINVNVKSPTPNGLAIDGGNVIPDETPNLQENPFFSGAAKKSEQKCLEYSKAATDVVHAIPLVTNQESISINVTKCEYNSMALIVGGSPAAIGEFPFMAAIGFADSDDQPEWRCGGTLISDKWVLTAAHCTFTGDYGEPKWVRLGALDMTKPRETERRDYDVDKIIPHPDYRNPIKYNDIALLSTFKKIEFSKFVRPACLYTKTDVQQKFAVATGWGQKEYAGSNSSKLLKVQLNIYDNSYCVRTYPANPKDMDQGIIGSMLCAGELKGGHDTCLGDSGGPLFVTEKENMCKFYVVGVTSFGKLCAQENVPAVYTRVSDYVNWIENTIW